MQVSAAMEPAENCGVPAARAAACERPHLDSATLALDSISIHSQVVCNRPCQEERASEEGNSKRGGIEGSLQGVWRGVHVGFEGTGAAGRMRRRARVCDMSIRGEYSRGRRGRLLLAQRKGAA